MNRIINENHRLYSAKWSAGKLLKKLLGIKCPHCGYFAKADNQYEEWAVDAFEHITYCNPAHKRAEAGERF